jgi:cytochrome c553
MSSSKFLGFTALTLALLTAAGTAGLVHAQGGGQGMGMGHGRGQGYGMGRGHGPGHKGNPVRHRIVRHGDGVPAPYRGKSNTLPDSAANISAGSKLYADNCATCHGKSGEGDGEAGKNLDPKPANLAFIMDKWIATDDFLMWSIAEGGKKLKTDMPAFKDTLTEKQRWQVIHYLRSGL